MNEYICQEHSGCVESIENLKSSDSKQWEALGTMRGRIDNVMTRLNVILGGVVVAVVLLLLNLLASSFKN